MNAPDYSNLTDELLSAYIDNAVTPSERALVEEAIAADPEIAWRLRSLRQTVELLHQLSDIPLPASFTLSEAMLGERVHSQVAELQPPLAGRNPRPASASPTLWQRVRLFWHSGSPILRNLAAASMAAFLLILAGRQYLVPALPYGAVTVASIPAPAAEAPAMDATGERASQGVETTAETGQEDAAAPVTEGAAPDIAPEEAAPPQSIQPAAAADAEADAETAAEETTAAVATGSGETMVGETPQTASADPAGDTDQSAQAQPQDLTATNPASAPQAESDAGSDSNTQPTAVVVRSAPVVSAGQAARAEAEPMVAAAGASEPASPMSPVVDAPAEQDGAPIPEAQPDTSAAIAEPMMAPEPAEEPDQTGQAESLPNAQAAADQSPATTALVTDDATSALTAESAPAVTAPGNAEAPPAAASEPTPAAVAAAAEAVEEAAPAAASRQSVTAREQPAPAATVAPNLAATAQLVAGRMQRIAAAMTILFALLWLVSLRRTPRRG